jgi:glycosyltransferase involved in cell wall biosynthesis
MARPARILYVHHGADLYGASRSLLRLVSSLPRERFEPHVLLPADGPLRGRLEAAGAPVAIDPGLVVLHRSLFQGWPARLRLGARIPSSVAAVRRRIRALGADLVHTNSAVIVSPGAAARLSGVPHLYHVREWFQEFARLWGPYAAYLTRSSAYVVAVSEAVAAQFPSRDNVVVVNNGFDLDEFRIDRAEAGAAFRRRFSLGAEPVIGCVGRIKRVRKGQEVLVEAAALLEARGCRARYVLVGAPFPGNESHLAALQELVAARGLAGRVVFTGEIEDTRQAYAAMDVLVLPSVQPEPFGGVVMEAMAMGVPVVATAIGGTVDQVAEGETGFLVPPGDPTALADRLQRLLADSDLRQAMSRAGPRRIAERFSMAETVRRLTGLYDAARAARRT